MESVFILPLPSLPECQSCQVTPYMPISQPPSQVALEGMSHNPSQSGTRNHSVWRILERLFLSQGRDASTMGTSLTPPPPGPGTEGPSHRAEPFRQRMITNVKTGDILGGEEQPGPLMASTERPTP